MDGAIAAYREAIRLKPNYYSAYFRLADALRIKGDADAAMAAQEEAIRLSRTTRLRWPRIGRLFASTRTII